MCLAATLNKVHSEECTAFWQDDRFNGFLLQVTILYRQGRGLKRAELSGIRDVWSGSREATKIIREFCR